MVMVFYYLFNIFSLFATIRTNTRTPNTPIGVASISTIGSIPITIPSASTGQPDMIRSDDKIIILTPSIPGIASTRITVDRITERTLANGISMP